MEIQIYGKSVLREVAKPVTAVTLELCAILDEIVPIMKNAHGVGLAAPQVGISRRFFVMNSGDRVRKVINPEIISKGDSFVEMEEGCLSLPGIHKKVKRARRISVRYTDETGAVVEEELKDFTARVFQHEYDHLDGILFVDRIAPIAQKLIAKQLESLAEKEAA